MTLSRADLPAKLTGSTVQVQFDFTSQLASGETISTEVVAASVYSGTDSSPSAIISGLASASGAVVSQNITAGVVGVIYELLCTITTSATRTLQQAGYLAVVDALP